MPAFDEFLRRNREHGLARAGTTPKTRVLHVLDLGTGRLETA